MIEVIYEPQTAGIGQLILFVASLLISYFTRPDPPPGPEDARASGLSDINVPTAQDGKPVPVLFGRRQIKSPNVIWYGDLKTDPIRRSTGG